MKLLVDPPIDAPTVDAVMARAQSENFPVASRLLPRRVRTHLLAVYGFARLVDELGDSFSGDRLAALDWLQRDLDRAYRGEAEHPLLKHLQRTLAECSLAREPFVRLIEANRVDQRVARYATWEQLRDYCALSANPVGELVLGVFGQATPARVARSDEICTALQLAEHCQDVAEDHERGRVYLPLADMARFGCTLADLSSAHAGEPLRQTVALQLTRARELLTRGAALIGELHGVRERFAVAAFVAGDGRRSMRSSAPAVTCSPARPAPARHGGCWRWLTRSWSAAGEHRRGIPAVRGDHARHGGQLLLRHPPAPARAPPGDVRGVRVRASRR